VDLVQVFASVRDASGQPVRGLGAEDFAVFDNDRLVSLQVVSEVAGAPPEGPSWSRTHSSNVATNNSVEEKRLVVLVIDDGRLGLYGRDRTRMLELGRAVVHNLAKDDLACVVFTATNRGAQDFTADRDLLLQAVDSLGGGFGSGNYAPVMAAYSVDVLRRVAETLADTSARRKVLVYLGTGHAIAVQPPNTSKPSKAPTPGSLTQNDIFNVSARVDALLKAAQKAGIAVYIIDPRRSVTDQRSPVTQFVKDVARHTGAIAVVGEPDSARAVMQILDDAGQYYILGFRADETVRPGLYRRLRVEVKRPGLSVRSQTGYYPPSTVLGNERFTELQGAPTTHAVASALPLGTLPLQMSLTSFAGARDGGPVQGQIGVAVAVRNDGEDPSTTTGAVEMEVRVFDGEGRKEVFSALDRRTILPSGQVSPQPVIQLAAGRYNVRVALRLIDGQLMGSVYGTVNVSDFAKDGLSASGVFVLDSGVPLEAWRSGVSSVRRHFSKTETVALVASVYAPQRSMSADVDIQVLNGADAIVHRESRKIELGPDTLPTGAVVRLDLPLGQWASGPYLAQIVIRSGKVELHRDLVFAVR
jgi:VWFA-related protein